MITFKLKLYCGYKYPHRPGMINRIMPAGNAHPSGHLVPSPIVGLACAAIIETRFLDQVSIHLKVVLRMFMNSSFS